MLDFVTGVIGTLLYPLFSIIFLLIDGIQAVFYGFAGIGTAYFDGRPITGGNTGVENDTGIIYYLLNNSLVKNMLLSMMILALFLIVIFTTFAFIKNAYAAKPKGWKDIIGNAIKGLGNFIFLPVLCLLGVWLGNILLNAINGATSNGGSTTMARKLFICCAYNANIYRNGDGKTLLDDREPWEKIQWYVDVQGLSDQFEVKEGQSLEYYANLVDQIYSTDGVFLGSHIEVAYFYNLHQINYLILIVGGIFMLYALGSLSAAMVRRLFLILVLFIISPGVCALYPIDEGKAVGSWAGKVKEQVLSAYGAVAGLNIFFSILPLIDKLSLWDSFSSFFMGDILELFILVVGLFVVKEIIGLVTSFTGGEDAYGKGTGMIGKAKEKLEKGAKTALGVASKSAGSFKKSWNDSKKNGDKFATRILKATGSGFVGAGDAVAGEVYKGLGLDKTSAAIKEGLAGTKGLSDIFKDAKKEDQKKAEEKSQADARKAISGDFEKSTLPKLIAGALTAKGEVSNMAQIMNALEEGRKRGISEDDVVKMMVKNAVGSGASDKDKIEAGEKLKFYIEEEKDKRREEKETARMQKINDAAAFSKGLDGVALEINTSRVALDAANAEIEKIGEIPDLKALSQTLHTQAYKKGNQSGNFRDAIEKMQAKNKFGKIEFDDTQMKNASSEMKKIIAEWNSSVEAHASKSAQLASAQEKQKSAQDSLNSSITKLRSTIETMADTFPNAKSKLDEFGDISKKTAEELEKIIKAIKNSLN